MSYSYFLFWDAKITDPMEEIYVALQESKLMQKNASIEKADSTIAIRFPKYEFTFSLISENWVLIESQDIADTFAKDRKDFSLIESSRERIEFFGGDDWNMDYFNESLLILETVSAKIPFVIFDANNCTFWE